MSKYEASNSMRVYIAVAMYSKRSGLHSPVRKLTFATNSNTYEHYAKAYAQNKECEELSECMYPLMPYHLGIGALIRSTL